MRKIFLLFVSLYSVTLKSQVSTSSYAEIKDELLEFLISAEQIRASEIEDYKSDKYKIMVVGIYNGLNGEKLIDGVYFFSTPSSHNKTYYLIIDGHNKHILDIDDRQGLEHAITQMLDFCERRKYCSSITQQYIANLITLYYKNKYPIKGKDINCETGITDVKELP